VSVDLIRAATNFLVAKGVEAEREREESASSIVEITDAEAHAAPSAGAAPADSTAASFGAFDPHHFSSTPSECELLMDHVEASPPMDLHDMRDAAALALQALPSTSAATLLRAADRARRLLS
jgi:hypothetical protein